MEIETETSHKYTLTFNLKDTKGLSSSTDWIWEIDARQVLTKAEKVIIAQAAEGTAQAAESEPLQGAESVSSATSSASKPMEEESL